MRDVSNVKEVRLGALVQYTPVKRGDYGAVLVMAGPHKGQVGYYDDDDESTPRRVDAIVYFGVMGEKNLGYYLLKHANLARLPDDFVVFVTTYVPPPSSGVELTVALKKGAGA